VATAGKSRVTFTVAVREAEHAGMGLLLAGQADGDPQSSKTSSALITLLAPPPQVLLSFKNLTVVQLVKFPARYRTLGSITIFT
jgi:hypothetical protein